MYNAATLDVTAGTNGGAASSLIAGPVTSQNSVTGWVINSMSIQWEPTAALLNQSGTVYLCNIPEWPVSSWSSSFPKLSYV